MASALKKTVPTPFCRRDTQVRVPFIWPEGELNLIDLDEEARKVLWPPLSDDSYDSDDSEPVEVKLPTGALTSFVSFRQQCMIVPESYALLPKAYNHWVAVSLRHPKQDTNCFRYADTVQPLNRRYPNLELLPSWAYCEASVSRLD